MNIFGVATAVICSFLAFTAGVAGQNCNRGHEGNGAPPPLPPPAPLPTNNTAG